MYFVDDCELQSSSNHRVFRDISSHSSMVWRWKTCDDPLLLTRQIAFFANPNLWNPFSEPSIKTRQNWHTLKILEEICSYQKALIKLDHEVAPCRCNVCNAFLVLFRGRLLSTSSSCSKHTRQQHNPTCLAEEHCGTFCQQMDRTRNPPERTGTQPWWCKNAPSDDLVLCFRFLDGLDEKMYEFLLLTHFDLCHVS